MTFEELLFRAKTGDEQTVDELMTMYKPLLIKEAIVNGMFDEDLYQEFRLTFLDC